MNINFVALDRSARKLYNSGWQADGSWHCSKCKTMIGKNLLGEKPHMLAWQHAQTCDGTPKFHTEKSWGPFPLKVRY